MTQGIKGYRNLRNEEVEAINTIKQAGEVVAEALRAAEKIEGHDPRWMAIAKTNLQLGFMAASRSVARPLTFA